MEKLSSTIDIAANYFISRDFFNIIVGVIIASIIIPIYLNYRDKRLHRSMRASIGQAFYVYQYQFMDFLFAILFLQAVGAEESEEVSINTTDGNKSTYSTQKLVHGYAQHAASVFSELENARESILVRLGAFGSQISEETIDDVEVLYTNSMMAFEYAKKLERILYRGGGIQVSKSELIGILDTLKKHNEMYFKKIGASKTPFMLQLQKLEANHYENLSSTPDRGGLFVITLPGYSEVLVTNDNTISFEFRS